MVKAARKKARERMHPLLSLGSSWSVPVSFVESTELFRTKPKWCVCVCTLCFSFRCRRGQLDQIPHFVDGETEAYRGGRQDVG